MNVLIPVLVFLVVVIVFVEIQRPHKLSFDFFSVFSFFYLLYQPLPALIILVFPDFFLTRFASALTLQPTINGWTVAFQWLFYLTFAASYFLSGNLPRVAVQRRKPELDAVAMVVMAVLAFNGLAFLVWSMDYGGPIDALAVANDLRQGAMERQVRFAFFKRFYDTTPLVAVFFVYILLHRHQLRSATRTAVYIFGPFTVLILFFAFLGHAGRASVILFLILCIAVVIWKPGPYLTKRFSGKRAVQISFGIAACILFLLYGNAIFRSLPALADGGSSYVTEVQMRHDRMSYALGQSGVFLGFSGYFMHHCYSIDAAMQGTNGGSAAHISYGREIPNAFVDLVPTRFTGRMPSVSTEARNTYVLRPARIMTGAAGGSVPPGSIASSIYMFGLFGPFLVPLVLGAITKKVERFGLRRFNGTGVLALFYVNMIFLMFPMVIGFQPQHYIRGNILDWALLALFGYCALVRGRGRVRALEYLRFLRGGIERQDALGKAKPPRRVQG
jgi:hypothetical protein